MKSVSDELFFDEVEVFCISVNSTELDTDHYLLQFLATKMVSGEQAQLFKVRFVPDFSIRNKNFSNPQIFLIRKFQAPRQDLKFNAANSNII